MNRDALRRSAITIGILLGGIGVFLIGYALVVYGQEYLEVGWELVDAINRAARAIEQHGGV